MIINHPVIEKISDRLICLAFTITLQEWEDIQDNGRFNFNSNLFEDALPATATGDIMISLIGSASLVEDNMQELVLKDPGWHILSCRINDRSYPTFYSSLNWSDLPDSFASSIISFASRKVAGNYPGELISEKALEASINKMITGLQGNAPEDPSSVATIAAELMKDFITSHESPIVSVREQVQEYLVTQGIPINFSESSFYFHVDHEKTGWNTEINLLPEDNVVALYSSVPLNEGKNGIAGLLEILNELNLSISYGNYEYSVSAKRLYFKNAFPVIGNKMVPEMLDEVMGHNFKQMGGILAIIDRIAPQ